MMRGLRRIPNLLTILRLALLVPLWSLAVMKMRTALGVTLAVAGLTDVLDGFLARRLGRTSRLGSQLDSVADMAIFTSIVGWLAMLRPEFFHAYGLPLLAWAALGLVTLAVGWIRFRRVVNLHLYSAKVAGFVGYLFVLYMLMFDGPAAPFFWVALAAAFTGTTESLLVLVTRSHVDEHSGSILIRSGARGR